jgi:hypothetical protein
MCAQLGGESSKFRGVKLRQPVGRLSLKGATRYLPSSLLPNPKTGKALHQQHLQAITTHPRHSPPPLERQQTPRNIVKEFARQGHGDERGDSQRVMEGMCWSRLLERESYEEERKSGTWRALVGRTTTSGGGGNLCSGAQRLATALGSGAGMVGRGRLGSCTSREPVLVQGGRARICRSGLINHFEPLRDWPNTR